MNYDLGRRNFLGLGLGATALALVPKRVSACFKKEATLEEQINAMPDSDFLKKYTPMITQNAVTYAGYSGGYHSFKLGAPEGASAQDQEKWKSYQLKDLFNQLFMKVNPITETVKLFLQDAIGVTVNPIKELRVDMLDNKVDDVRYIGKDKKVKLHTGIRPGHILWFKDEIIRIDENYISSGVIQQLKGYVILQNTPEEPPKKDFFGEVKTKSNGLAERTKKFGAHVKAEAKTAKEKAKKFFSKKPDKVEYTWDQPPKP